jgi:putative glycosyltransferase (TIGR04372 family)
MKFIFDPKDTYVERDISGLLHTRPALIQVDLAKEYLDIHKSITYVFPELDRIPLVVIVFRDSAHDLIHYPDSVLNQSYRNSPPSILNSIINYYVNTSRCVIRMGRDSVANDRSLSFPRYLDYSHQKSIQSSAADFMLFQKSSYVISTGSGVDEIGAFLRKKVCLFNVAPPNSPFNTVTYPIALASDYLYLGKKLSMRELSNLKVKSLHPRDIPPEMQIWIRPKGQHLVMKFIEFFDSCFRSEFENFDTRCVEFALQNKLEKIGNVLY